MNARRWITRLFLASIAGLLLVAPATAGSIDRAERREIRQDRRELRHDRQELRADKRELRHGRQ